MLINFTQEIKKVFMKVPDRVVSQDGIIVLNDPPSLARKETNGVSWVGSFWFTVPIQLHP